MHKEYVTVDRYKTRLIEKDFKQNYGIDYDEVFALVARFDTKKLILTLVVLYGWKVFQLNVKSIFLNGILKEEVYVDRPEYYKIVNNLLKSIF